MHKNHPCRVHVLNFCFFQLRFSMCMCMLHVHMCMCMSMCTYGCACYTHAVHMAHVTEAPRLSKAREVRHRRRRARRCARRCARRRTEGYVPRIVHGAAVTRQRAELGRHRGELWVRACKGRAAVARVPVPLRRPAQCGVQPRCACTAHTHHRTCTAHASRVLKLHVLQLHGCRSVLAVGFARRPLTHIGLQPLAHRVAACTRGNSRATCGGRRRSWRPT